MTAKAVYSAIASGSAILMLALLVLIGQHLGVDDYGAFRFAITLATVAEAFMDFGLHQVTIREVARRPSAAAVFLRTSLALKLIPGLVMFVCFGVAAFVLRDQVDVRIACLLMLGGAAMRSFVLTARGVLQGLERFGADALITTGDRVLLLAGCGAAVVAGGGLIGTALAFLLVRILTAAASLILVRRLVGRGRVDPVLWRWLPQEALPIGTFLLVLGLYNHIDTIMLGSLASDRETGLYGAAYPLYEGLTYGSAILASVLAPWLSRLWVEDRTEYRRVARRALAWSAIGAVGVAGTGWIVSAALVPLVWGTEYAAAVSAFRLLLLALPCIYVLWVLHAVALSSQHNRALVLVTAIGAVFNGVLNWWVIPVHGATGAAATTLASELVVMAALFVSLWDAIVRPTQTTSATPSAGLPPATSG